MNLIVFFFDFLVFRKPVLTNAFLCAILNIFSKNMVYFSIFLLPNSQWSVMIIKFIRHILNENQLEINSLFQIIWGSLLEYLKRRLFVFFNEMSHKRTEICSIIQSFDFPIFIFDKNNKITLKNQKANDILDIYSNFSRLYYFMENKSPKFEFDSLNVIFNGHIRDILLDNKKCWVCYLTDLVQNKILKEFLTQNKLLFKKSEELLKIMEDDFNKWSNLKSMKYIDESEMQNLAICIAKMNFLKNELSLNQLKSSSLINKESHKKKRNFNIRNLMVQSVEIISVVLLSKNYQISLKFEKCFPEKVYGDYKNLKEVKQKNKNKKYFQKTERLFDIFNF